MCERYSWINRDGSVYFLTANDVFHTKRGKQLQQYSLRREDWHGHGATRWYYDFVDGADRECTDFSTPSNFPKEIVKAIKAGDMWEFGITDDMHCMLLKTAYAKYHKIQKTALAKYLKIHQTAWASIWDNPKNRKKCWR